MLTCDKIIVTYVSNARETEMFPSDYQPSMTSQCSMLSENEIVDKLSGLLSHKYLIFVAMYGKENSTSDPSLHNAGNAIFIR